MAGFDFFIGEVVWAKIRGYPWWPAIVKKAMADPKENKYMVYFIGDNTHSTLPESKLANFQKNFKDYSKTKKGKLVESIKKAKDMIDNKDTKEIKEVKEPKESKEVKDKEKDHDNKEKEHFREKDREREKERDTVSIARKSNDETASSLKEKNILKKSEQISSKISLGGNKNTDIDDKRLSKALSILN